MILLGTENINYYRTSISQSETTLYYQENKLKIKQ